MNIHSVLWVWYTFAISPYTCTRSCGFPCDHACHCATQWQPGNWQDSAIPWQRAVLSLLLSAGSGWVPQHRITHISPPSKEGGGKALASLCQCQQGGPGWDHAAMPMCQAPSPLLCARAPSCFSCSTKVQWKNCVWKNVSLGEFVNVVRGKENK